MGAFRDGTFWLTEQPQDTIYFRKINTQGTVLQSFALEESLLFEVLGCGYGGWFTASIGDFAVLESGIVVSYFPVAQTSRKALGLLTFDGQFKQIELPDVYEYFLFYNSRDNALIIHLWSALYCGHSDFHPNGRPFRLDGTKLEWSEITPWWH